MAMPTLVLVLRDVAVVALAAHLGGRAARRLGFPAVLGELVAGVLLAAALLGDLFGLPDLAGVAGDDASGPVATRIGVLEALASLGAVLLLLETGLESDVRALRRVGASSLGVAVVGIAASFAVGLAASWALAAAWPSWAAPSGGSPWLLHVFVGAALTATSVGITARVLADLGRLATPEARIVLGAAVLDDLGGLAILAAVAVLAGAGLGGAALDGLLVVGAFAAGLALSRTRVRSWAARARPFVAGVVGLFFATLGMRLDLAQAAGRIGPVLAIGLGLTALAVLGKLASGLAVVRRQADRLVVGVGMVPRGEVGLIFAGLGLATGLLANWQYAALLVMVFLTTLLTPLWLSRLKDRFTRGLADPPVGEGIARVGEL